jgi:hypothetical protein
MAISKKKRQENAKLMAAAFAKNGAVAQATNAEIRQAMYDLADLNDQAGVNQLIAEEVRRRAAMAALKAALVA